METIKKTDPPPKGKSLAEQAAQTIANEGHTVVVTALDELGNPIEGEDAVTTYEPGTRKPSDVPDDG